MDSTKDPLLVPMKSGKSLLLDLPAEIRLIIYGYILTSPNGYIEPISVWSYDRSTRTHSYQAEIGCALVASPMCNRPFFNFYDYLQYQYLDIALLRTCKKVYHEAKDSMLHLNTLVWVLPWERDDTEDPLHWTLERASNLRIELQMREPQSTFINQLERVARCIKPGVLRKLAIQLQVGVKDIVGLMKEGVTSPPWTPIIQLWKAGGDCVRRKLEFQINAALKAHYDSDPTPRLKSPHQALGGELWIGDKLFYKDGREVLCPFIPSQGEWRFVKSIVGINFICVEGDYGWEYSEVVDGGVR